MLLTEFLNQKEPFSLIKWIKNTIYVYKLNKAIDKWNNDIPYIEKCIEEDNKELPHISDKENYRPHRLFYWRQLVWQEIDMYIKIGKKVDISDFVWLCNRRGFTLNEQNYLQDMLVYMNLI